MPRLPRSVFFAMGTGVLSYLIYVALLLFGMDTPPNQTTYGLVSGFGLVVFALSFGLARRSRISYWIAIIVLAAGGILGVPNALAAPQFGWFYLLQGLLQLAAATALVLPSARGWFSPRPSPLLG
jgi:lysylphosphatidylglycerol synthetase-like protein (DUF2156 family)